MRTKYAIGRANAHTTSSKWTSDRTKSYPPTIYTNIIDWYHWVPLGNDLMSQLSIFARNENCDFKMVHLTPIRMAPLNSPYFSSHECIFLGCLELYYRCRYRQQAREFMRKMKEKWVARGGLFLRGRKHRHTFPRGPTIQCLFIINKNY
jgi:hypothetical protein